MCGGEHAVCGPPSDSVPADERMEVAAVGGQLKKYKVTSPSGVETVMKLNEADAEARGLSEDDLVQPTSAEPETLSLPAEDAEPEPEQAPEEKAASAPNKARTSASNKGRGARGGD